MIGIKSESAYHIGAIILGTALVWLCFQWWAVLYIAIAVVGTVYFWYSICTHCLAFATDSCPS